MCCGNDVLAGSQLHVRMIMIKGLRFQSIKTKVYLFLLRCGEACSGNVVFAGSEFYVRKIILTLFSWTSLQSIKMKAYAFSVRVC